MNYTELSKAISYVLCHVPWEYELEMGEQGWFRLISFGMHCIGQRNGETFAKLT